MKRILYIVLSMTLVGLAACSKKDKEEVQAPKKVHIELTAYQELELAYRAHGRFNKDKKDKRSLSEAEYHFANVVVRDDSTDSLRVKALYMLHNIESYGAYGRTNYAKALMYINRCIEYAKAGVGNDINLAQYYAHKGDDLWHYGEIDSAIHYCHKAMSFPVRKNWTDYIVAYVLKHIYHNRQIPDSAAYYQQRFEEAAVIPLGQIRGLDVHSPQSASAFMAEMERTIAQSKKSKDCACPGAKTPAATQQVTTKEAPSGLSPFAIRIIVLLIIAMLFTAWYIYKNKKRPPRVYEYGDTPQQETEEPQPQLTEEERGETFALPESLILRRSLADGRRAFEHTASYDDLNTMQIKEKELYDMAFEATRDVESSLFAAFKEACATLIENAELNDQELICCFCTYLGYSNNVIAYIGHTAPGTIRKRKDRIKKKLPTDFCDVIFGGKG